VLPHVIALENAIVFKCALQMSRFTLLYFTFILLRAFIYYGHTAAPMKSKLRCPVEVCTLGT